MTAAELRPGRIDVTVVIPLKWSGTGEAYRVEEMARYLDGLRHAVAEVVVVDGSAPSVRSEHERAWKAFARILEPDDSVVGAKSERGEEVGLNRKVVGALTGIHSARTEYVVLADDDVRHTPGSIQRLVETLQDADLVRPVNVFDSWPWHARWDGARTLLNLVLASDWPGTFALRRSTVLELGGWSADVLFENLELWRTVASERSTSRRRCRSGPLCGSSNAGCASGWPWASGCAGEWSTTGVVCASPRTPPQS